MFGYNHNYLHFQHSIEILIFLIAFCLYTAGFKYSYQTVVICTQLFYFQCSYLILIYTILLFQVINHIYYYYYYFQTMALLVVLFGCTAWMLTKHMEKKLDRNYTTPGSNTPTKQLLFGYLRSLSQIIQVRRTRHAGRFWRSKEELISNVGWTPINGRTSVGWPARTYFSFVWTLDIVRKNCRERYMIESERASERERERERERHTHRDRQTDSMLSVWLVTTTTTRVNLRVKAMKGYFKYPSILELEPHNQIQISIAPWVALFV